MTPWRSVAGKQLYDLLPEVYRTRDNGDLAAYLDACGELLDGVRNTLAQRLADCFPGETGLEKNKATQAWVLSYLARLVDARLLSPHVEGRRAEVAKAVGWRQRKGTLGVVEEIAEAVGGLEVEIQEGWRRVAITPRIGLPMVADAYAGTAWPMPVVTPLEAARNTALPAVTADFRRALDVRNVADPGAPAEWKYRRFPARAFRLEPGKKAMRWRRSKEDGEVGLAEFEWRLPHPHGAPCFPGSYEDGCRRTVDLRTPSWAHGHVHPRRVLLSAAPPSGFFPVNRLELQWAERESHKRHIGDEFDQASGVRYLRNRHWRAAEPDAGRSVVVTTHPASLGKNGERQVVIHGLGFLVAFSVPAGVRLRLRGVAAKKVEIEGQGGSDGPVLDAVECLFDEVDAGDGLVRLEYCTVRTSLRCGRLQASDCLFGGELSATGNWDESCVRYSRVPASVADELQDRQKPGTTIEEPVFFDYETCEAAGGGRSTIFGRPGCGLLHPVTPSSIRFGAEDGGEMGAGHRWRYTLREAAVLAKLTDHLPLGLEAVLIPDPRLLVVPPAPREEQPE